MAIKGYEIKPKYATPPGNTLEEVLKDRLMTKAELSDRIGLTPKTISNIISGKAPITPETASKLELVLGVPSTFWNNLELRYREGIEEKRKEEEYEKQLDFIKTVPYSEMAKVGLVPKTRNSIEKISNLLRFFSCASVEILTQKLNDSSLLEGAYRGSTVAEVDRIALYGWIRQGEIKAQTIQTKEFDRNIAKKSLVLLRELTNETNPDIFIPEIQKICSNFGVAVVFVPEVKGSRVCGLTRWLTPYPKAIIQLSLRYKTNDHLWFTFFHELSHIILHNKQPFYTFNREYQDSSDEKEANEYAANILIKELDFEEFIESNRISKDSVLMFAKSQEIHPGIVVGRLQKRGIIAWNQMNDLKVRYQWDI